MRHLHMTLKRAMACAALAGAFALTGPSLGLAEEPGLDPDEYTFEPAYLPPEPDQKILAVICTSLARTEIAKEFGVAETTDLTVAMKQLDFVATGYECEYQAADCDAEICEDAFEFQYTEEEEHDN